MLNSLLLKLMVGSQDGGRERVRVDLLAVAAWPSPPPLIHLDLDSPSQQNHFAFLSTTTSICHPHQPPLPPPSAGMPDQPMSRRSVGKCRVSSSCSGLLLFNSRRRGAMTMTVKAMLRRRLLQHRKMRSQRRTRATQLLAHQQWLLRQLWSRPSTATRSTGPSRLRHRQPQRRTLRRHPTRKAGTRGSCHAVAETVVRLARAAERLSLQRLHWEVVGAASLVDSKERWTRRRRRRTMIKRKRGTTVAPAAEDQTPPPSLAKGASAEKVMLLPSSPTLTTTTPTAAAATVVAPPQAHQQCAPRKPNETGTSRTTPNRGKPATTRNGTYPTS